MYAARPDSNAAALVVIDPPRPGAGPGEPEASLLVMSPWLARAGVLRAGRILSSRADGLGGPSGGAVRSFLNRPDHLARAAREISTWDDTVTMAARADVGGEVPIVTVDVNARDRVAFLTDPADVDRVVQAIATAVDEARQRR
jgi:hypothetical protein